MTDILNNRHFHFIAIGGVGMSALAKYLIENGYNVSGSDIEENKYTKMLNDMGAKVYIGQRPENIQGTPTIISSTAIKEDNPELKRAKELNLTILHRSDLLQLIAKKFSDNEKSTFIGFVGTHGKTTTSGMCAFVMSKANLMPSYIVGGTVPELNNNAKYNSDNYFVAELDESDGTILKYQPDISVINNLEADHLDFYTNGFEDLIKTFNIYIANLKENAKIIINNDCEGNQELIRQNPDKKFITFGLKNADYIAQDIKFENFGSSFTIYKNNEKLTDIKLILPGLHNIYNALAVFAALNEANISPESFSQYFSTFTGMGRRFQIVSEFNNIKIIDDYAHHPTEIKTTLEGVKKATNSRIIAVFQPHRYTRLQGLWDEFLTSFNDADKLVVTDIYAASEKAIDGISTESFCLAINHKDTLNLKGSIKEVANQLFPILMPNDVVLTLGAGDITYLGKYLEEIYNKEYQNICK